MRIFSFYAFAFFSFLFIACSDDDVVDSKNSNYNAEHVLMVDKIQASGFGAIVVTGIFNISYDPSISEIGFVLTNNLDESEIKKILDIKQLKSKETIFFNNLPDGNYSVKTYLIHGEKNEIYSQSKSISLLTNSETDYNVSCLFDYMNKSGKPVLIANVNDRIFITIFSKYPLVPEKVYCKLSDKIFEVSFIENMGWSDDLYKSYVIVCPITEDIPIGENSIELIFQDQVSFDTGIILDRLSGRWEELNSLYTGNNTGGVKVFFQNERYGFFVQLGSNYLNPNDYSVFTDIQLFRMDFNSLKWRKLSFAKFEEQVHKLYPTVITKDGKAYIIFTTYNHIQIWEYDMSTDTWTRKINIEEKELPHDPIIFAHKTKFYIIGGRYLDNNQQEYYLSDRKWVYDVVDNSIVESKNSYNMIEAFDGYYYSTFETEKYSYVISSKHNNVWEYKILRYSDNTQLFEKVESPYKLLSSNGVSYTFNNKVYYIGGLDHSRGGHKYCYTYSEDTGQWMQIADFPYYISDGIAFKFNSKVYVGMGNGYYDTSITLHSWKE